MKLTNRSNLPDALVRAVKNDSYTKGGADYSVTELLKPPRIRALSVKHADEIEEDVTERIWSLIGQSIHSILERSNKADLVEERFFGKIGSHTISGQVDNLALESGVLQDYKVTTSYKFKAGRVTEPDWEAQLNILLELLRQNGKEVKSLAIIGILRDWSKLEAKRNPDYPQLQVVNVPIDIWPREKTISFIEMRIALHEQAKAELPECTSDEMWAEQDIYAVMKGKRAINGGKQFSLRAAEEMQAKNPGTFIEHRPGERKRCAYYCSVAKFCSVYQEYVKSVGVVANEEQVG